MTDIVEAVQTRLQEFPPVQDLVTAELIGKDAGFVNGWIFDSSLSVSLEGKQKAAIVVSYGGGHDTPDPDSAVKFPVVVVDIWADPTRSDDGSVAVHDAKSKVFRVWDAVDAALHIQKRTEEDGTALFFGDVRIITSQRLGDPDLQWVKDGDGARMLRCRYGITYY